MSADIVAAPVSAGCGAALWNDGPVHSHVCDWRLAVATAAGIAAVELGGLAGDRAAADAVAVRRRWLATGIAPWRHSRNGPGLRICLAAWLAHIRMADALPGDWEGRDITLTGVVATLPQSYERSVRFEFDVEQVRTPEAQVPRRIVCRGGAPAVVTALRCNCPKCIPANAGSSRCA